jgi:hypothetical protein
MKRFSFIMGVFVLCLGLLLGQLDLVGMVQRVSASHGRLHSFVLPAFKRVYQTGVVLQDHSQFAYMHLNASHIDVNGDGLLDMVYQNDKPMGYAQGYPYQFFTQGVGTWYQEVWLNNGVGYDQGNVCSYGTRQEYDSSCL